MDSKVGCGDGVARFGTNFSTCSAERNQKRIVFYFSLLYKLGQKAARVKIM